MKHSSIEERTNDMRSHRLKLGGLALLVDPDEDVRLVVLPPPYMVESLASGHVDGFCVGAPWNSVAVESGVGRILHFGSEIMARVSEKVLAVREPWADENPAYSVCAHSRAGGGSQRSSTTRTISRSSAAVARGSDVAADLVGSQPDR